MLGVVYGTIGGLLQSRPKRVLAYSSISKMGLLSSGFGIALAYPENASLLLVALTLYVLHHALVKSALFLGLDLLDRGIARHWVMLGVLFLGLALIGAPLTSGALAKARLGAALPETVSWFATWLTISAVVTTLLIGRLAFLLQQRQRALSGAGYLPLATWMLLVIAVAAFPVPLVQPHETLHAGVLPITAGALAVWLIWYFRPHRLSALVKTAMACRIAAKVGRALRSCSGRQLKHGAAWS